MQQCDGIINEIQKAKVMWVRGASSESNHCISSGGIAVEMITLITLITLITIFYSIPNTKKTKYSKIKPHAQKKQNTKLTKKKPRQQKNRNKKTNPTIKKIPYNPPNNKGDLCKKAQKK